MPERSRTISEIAPGRGDATIEDRIELVHGFGLRIMAKGRGEPFLWAHDALSSIEDDDAHPIVDFDMIAEQRRLIRYDAVGHGRSAGVTNPSDHTWESRGDDLLQLCERLQLSTASLGGFCTGAATALWAAHLDPARVDRLVLCGLPNGWAWRAPAAGFQGLLGISALVGITEPARYLARYLPLPQRPVGSIGAYQVAHFRRVVHTPRRRFVAALVGAAQSNLPTPDELATLDIPTLVMAYPGDPLRPVGTSVRVARALPDAELVIADHPDDVADWSDLICDFLAA